MPSGLFLRAREGGVSIITAVSSVVLIGFTGLAVDTGSVYLESRRLQGSADLAALAAMQNPAQAEALAAATVAANRWPHDTRVRVVLGTHTPDRSVRPAERFRPDPARANAVRVEVTTSAPLFFGRLFVPAGRMTIRREATAAETQLASFQIGTRLLSLQGGIANEVLGGLTGSNVNLSVMDYNALLRANVDVLDYVDALRTRLDIEAASYNETLDAHADAPVALEALADVVAETDERAERALRAMARASERNRPLRGLSDVLDLGPYGPQDHATRSADTAIQVSAMDLATAILQVANGQRQVQLDLGAGVPGLASTNVWLAIGERPNNSPWLTVTNDEEVVIRTAQTRLYVETSTSAGALANVRIPILLELASGQARLQEINCGWGGANRAVTLGVSPGIGSLSLGEVDRSRLNNFRSDLRPAPAQMVRVGVARVEGEARVDVGGHEWQSVRFSDRDIERGAVKSVSTRDTARATVSSLLRQTKLTVHAGGLGLSTSALTSAVQSVLTSAAGPLDNLVNGLSDLLGVRLGEADVRVNGVRCGGAALVA
ncbi:MAG: pilus assembly protein TadG-related protein [Hyphomonadaceae bacterium]